MTRARKARGRATRSVRSTALGHAGKRLTEEDSALTKGPGLGESSGVSCGIHRIAVSVAVLSAIDQHHEGRRVEEGTAGSPGSTARATVDPYERREAGSPGSAKPSELKLRRSALMATRGEANDTHASTLRASTGSALASSATR